MVIPPLKKRTLQGDLYERDPEVEALLIELSALSRDELILRASIARRADAGYVPSECLVHFIRASRFENSEAWFEQLYRVLAERVLRCLPKADSGNSNTASLTRETIRDKVFWRFVELLSIDREAYVEKLDFFEIRFDGALANLRRDAQEKAWRDENRSTSLEFDDESGELSTEVEKAAGSYDPFATSGFDDADYRLRLQAAIDALPEEQTGSFTCCVKDFPSTPKSRASQQSPRRWTAPRKRSGPTATGPSQAYAPR